jgi:hypothetical protein
MYNAKSKFIIIMLLIYAISITWTYGQNLYEIKGATVVIDLDYGDSIVQLQSRHLHINLDNDNAEFIAKLKINTFMDTDDENLFQWASSEDEVMMTGKFEVDHIETTNHTPMQFGFSGVLTQNLVSIPISGTSELQHIGAGGAYSCMLGFSFILDERILKEIDIVNLNLKKVKVQVLQTILNENTAH